MLLDLKPESPDDISKRAGYDIKGMKSHLEDMAERGLINRIKSVHGDTYGASPFVPGIYEFQVADMDRELAELYEQFSEEAFHKSMGELSGVFLRPVPVNEAVEVKYQIAPYNDARQILKNADRIALAECICRKQKGLIDQGCGKPRETCMLFGDFGQHFIDRGLARQVSAEEAIQILEQCREAGLISQPNSSQNPGGMCNCCGDCCMSLQALNRLPKPAEMVMSDYFAHVEKEICTGCGTCMERCQMCAVTMDADELADINLDRCIGCGLCVDACPEKAISLQLKSEDQQKVVPVSINEMMGAIAAKRGL